MTQMAEPDTEPRQIYDPIIDTPLSYEREPDGIHPPLDSPPVQVDAAAPPEAAARLPAPGA